MKILSKILIFLFLLTTLNAVETETEFTKGVNTSTDCQLECPPMKDGYFARIVNFNYETGETTCYAYSTSNPIRSLATVINRNPFCSKHLINPNQATNIDSSSTRAKSYLDSVSKNVKDNYTNGGMSNYVNLPKFMVAGLMADDKIVDISSSIANNEVVLNGGYTNEVNLNSVKGVDTEMLGRVKDSLANSVTFVMNFLSLSDKTLLSFKVSLFLFVVALSVILLLTQKATKKASQVSDHEDITEKILFGVGSILVFFLTLNKIETSTGQISQTGYQQIIRPLIYMGISTADKLTETATASVLKYKLSAVGIVAGDDLKALENLKYKLEVKKKTFDSLFKSECLSTYNVDEFKYYTQSLATNYKFPQSEYISTTNNSYTNNNVLSNQELTFYTKKFMKDYEGSIQKGNVPTVSFCFKLEKATTEMDSQIKELTAKLKNLSASKVNEQVLENTSRVVDLVYKNIAEFGFVGIGNIATATLAFNHFSLIREDVDKNEVIVEKTKKIREVSGYEVSSIVDGEGIISSEINDLITQAPLMMLPMAESTKKFVEGVINPFKDDEDRNGNNKDGLITSVMKKLSIKGWVQQALSFVANITLGYISTVVTLWILSSMLAVAPLLAMIGASFLVMSFYFLSIEILYVVIPFASIFAFSTGNLEIIKSLIKNTFILAVKPVLIVVSMVMALFVYEMFTSLNNVLTTGMLEPLFALANNLVDNSSYLDIKSQAIGFGDSSIFLLIRSAMQVVSSVITIFVCFYLVFNGANIILDLLGMRDGGFDVGGVIGDKVEGKSTVQKGNTLS